MKKQEEKKKKKTVVSVIGLTVGTACVVSAAVAADLDRTTLPIPEPERQPSSVFNIKNATPPERFEVKAPEGAPNVIIVLIDDLGFAGTST